ncbi:MAG: chemotaxis protein CheC [Nanoarchaeota archaeon]
MAEKIKNEGLSNLQKDALKEISSITTGNATAALSKLVKKKVNIQIPKSEFYDKNELCDILGGKDDVVVSIYCGILADLTGQVLFLFKRKDALDLVKMLTGKKMNTKYLDRYSESAFGEMANIFTGSYLNALSELFQITILPGIPIVATDYMGPIIDYVWGRIENPEKKMLCFTTKISLDDYNINGYFVFMFDAQSYHNVLKKLESDYGVKSRRG